MTEAIAEELDGDGPVELVPMTDEYKEAEPKIDLFKLDGIIYSIPARPRPSIAMTYLYYARERGVGFAEGWLAENLLGKEAYQALLNFGDLTQESSDEIFSRARAVVFGRREVPKAGSGTPRSTGPARKQSRKRGKAAGS